MPPRSSRKRKAERGSDFIAPSSASAPRKRIGGLDFTKSNAYPVFYPAQDTGVQIKTAHAIPGTNLQTDRNVNFVVMATRGEWIRFPPRPFLLTYRIEVKNARYAAGTDAVATKWPNHLLQADRREPLVWIDPQSAATAFFDEAYVSLDGYDINSSTNMRGQMGLYQSVSQIFTTSEERALYYNRSEQMRRAEDETIDTVVTTPFQPAVGQVESVAGESVSHMRPNLAGAVEATSFSSKDPDSAPLTATFGFDSVFCLGYPRDPVLGKLYGRRGEPERNGFLPPETKVAVNLFKPTPGDCHLVRAIPDATYYSDVANAGQQYQKLTIRYIGLELLYESCRLEPLANIRAGRQLTSGKLRYFNDCVKITYANLGPKLSYTFTRFEIRPGSKLAYLLFSFPHQLWYVEDQKKHRGGHPYLPPELDTINIKLNNEKILFDGLKTMGSACPGEGGPRLWYQYLKNKGLTDRPYNDFFPHNGENSYLMAFPLDLTAESIAVPGGNLDIECYWNASLSPSSGILVCMTVQESCLTRSRDRVWTRAILV